MTQHCVVDVLVDTFDNVLYIPVVQVSSYKNMDLNWNMNYDIPSNLPNVLRNMLGHLLDNYNVQGWNIFPNEREQICLTIRFDCESLHDGSTHVPNSPDSVFCVYRKVSARQQNRARF